MAGWGSSRTRSACKPGRHSRRLRAARSSAQTATDSSHYGRRRDVAIFAFGTHSRPDVQTWLLRQRTCRVITAGAPAKAQRGIGVVSRTELSAWAPKEVHEFAGVSAARACVIACAASGL